MQETKTPIPSQSIPPLSRVFPTNLLGPCGPRLKTRRTDLLGRHQRSLPPHRAVVGRHRRRRRLSVPPGIHDLEVGPQPQRQTSIEEHEGCADTHTRRIIRRGSRRKRPRAQQRAALPYNIHDGDAGAAPRIAALVRQQPRQNIRNGREHAGGGQKHADVAHRDGAARREQHVAGAADQRQQCDDQAALLQAVGQPRRPQADEEGGEVGRRREPLGVDGGEAHARQHGGEEDGQRGKGHIAREVHEGLDPGLRGLGGGEDLGEVEVAEGAALGGAGVGVAGGAKGAGAGEGFFVVGEEVGGGDGVGEQEEDDEGEHEGRDGLNDEEEAPAGDAVGARGDAVGQRAGKGGG